jgi:hypothetical protein
MYVGIHVCGMSDDLFVLGAWETELTVIGQSVILATCLLIVIMCVEVYGATHE